MDSSIYISTQHIEVLGYNKTSSVELLAYAKQPLGEGVIINGKITDPTELSEKLTQLKALRPDLFTNCTLVIDSTTLLLKKLPVPELKKPQYLNLVKDELVDQSENSAEMIYDYSFINSKGEAKTMLACATHKSTVESYLSVFGDAGINLKAVRVGLETIINYIKTRKDLAKKTFILNIVDGVSMLSVIFENGQYIFSTRTRLMEEESAEYLTTIISSLSSLLQFNKSQKFSDIEESFYLGLSKHKFSELRMLYLDGPIKLKEFDNLKFARNADIVTDDCHFSFFGIHSSATSLNLLQSYKNALKPLKEYKPFRVSALIPYFVLLILGITYATPLWLNMQLDTEIEKINSFLTDRNTITQITEIEELERKISILKQANLQITNKTKEINDYPIISMEILNVLTQSNSNVVTVYSFEFNAMDSSIEITANAATEADAANYVKNMKSHAFINDIEYTGYSYDNRIGFNFTCKVTLKTG